MKFDAEVKCDAEVNVVDGSASFRVQGLGECCGRLCVVCEEFHQKLI